VALPDYIKSEFGTAVIWGESGASGVTKTLTFEALAAGSARMGASADLGAAWDQDYYVQLIIESGSAPTAGGAIDLYIACSYDNSTWPAGVSGSDGAWPSDGNEDEWAKQLGRPVCSLIATNDGTAIQVQQPVIWRPRGRYVAPVVDNNWDQAVRDEATATNNDSRVILVPVRTFIQDTA
jgi:hypothetical protein